MAGDVDSAIQRPVSCGQLGVSLWTARWMSDSAVDSPEVTVVHGDTVMARAD
jgi:hypothetical protein